MARAIAGRDWRAAFGRAGTSARFARPARPRSATESCRRKPRRSAPLHSASGRTRIFAPGAVATYGAPYPLENSQCLLLSPTGGGVCSRACAIQTDAGICFGVINYSPGDVRQFCQRCHALIPRVRNSRPREHTSISHVAKRGCAAAAISTGRAMRG
jgi:hypothetical protein